MGLISAAIGAAGGTVADQWLDYVTAPVFGEEVVLAPGLFLERKAGRDAVRRSSTNIISDGSRIAVPENAAAIVTDGGRIVSLAAEPGYFVLDIDSQPSLFAGASLRDSLVRQSWERFRFGGRPGREQRVVFVNLREIRGLRFGTPGLLPYRDFSLVPDGSAQAPVLRLRARGRYSVRVIDPIRFFKNFIPANTSYYSLVDDGAIGQLRHEFLTAFQAALQSLSRKTDISSLSSYGPELAAALTNESGPNGSWKERFGLEVVSATISSIEYDAPSRELMDKYNQGLMLGGRIGNAYTQTTVAEAATAMAENGQSGAGMTGLALGLGAISGAMAGMNQPDEMGSPPPQPGPSDPVAVLSQLKTMRDEGLITPEQYAAKQKEVLARL